MNDFLSAIKAGDAAAAERLLDAQPDLSTARNEHGASLVALACYHGQPGIARLIAARRPLDLWEACMLGDLARVQTLVEAGADLNQPAPDGFPPFALAVFFGQPEVYRYLLTQGADVNQPAVNAMRVAAIHAAASRRDAAALALILAHGGDANLRQQGGWTALHAAAASGDLAMVDLLMKAGAEASLLTEKGETAADLAGGAGHAEVAARLMGEK